ncbi:MAG: 4Fe-4S binding protein [Anaerolineae bacterium]|nr:4Fe-4S binding protein [Anaerolineae bacterium]
MNLLGIADRLAASPPPLRVQTERCVHALNSASTCDLCVRACAFDALRLSPTITLDENRCTACGACLHVCPVDAIRGDDGVAKLLNLAPRFEAAQSVELACARHPRPEQGPAGSELVLRAAGCLAALGPSTYASLHALGFQRIVVRLDACAGCPLGAARPQIEARLTSARSLLDSVEPATRLETIDASATDWTARPVYAVNNPPVSRRSLFRLFAAEAPRVAARALLPVEEATSETTQPPRERRRLLNALQRLTPAPPPEGEGAGVRAVSHLPFIHLQASDACNACGACARVCPTSAMRLRLTNEATFRLSFQPAACTDCGLCLDLCEPGALSREPVADLASIVSQASLTLREGEVHICEKCGARFAGAPGATLCPLCDFRRRNPFGSRLPRGRGRPMPVPRVSNSASQGESS